MTTLVVGTVPPPGGEAAAQLAALASQLRATGERVEVLSPDRRSAAHHHGSITGPMLALQLIRRSRSCDGVVIAFGPGVPLAATAGRVERAVTLGLLGVALRSFSDVTLRLASPIPLPGGVGGRATAAMWSRATSIVVENEADRERVVLAPGVDAACLVVRPTAAPAHGGRSMAWNELHFDTADLRSQVQLAVRERAAEARRVNSARVELGAKGVLDDGAGPFSGTSARVSPPDPIVLARVFAGRVRRVLRKLATQP